jgi:hypothetical protein
MMTATDNTCLSSPPPHTKHRTPCCITTSHAAAARRASTLVRAVTWAAGQLCEHEVRWAFDVIVVLEPALQRGQERRVALRARARVCMASVVCVSAIIINTRWGQQSSRAGMPSARPRGGGGRTPPH